MTADTPVQSTNQPSTLSQVQDAVRASVLVMPVGAGTKPALHGDGAIAQLELTKLAGIVEYEPDEYTFTAWAGTRLADIQQALGENGQYLPFDPPLVQAGATLGGTIAAGLSGSGRYRYGGLRDFILGVRVVDGQGQVVRGGGKVVKNAAGFDLPKLMVGSLGRLGIIAEASFKVFPAPAAYATLCAGYASMDEALAATRPVMQGAFDLEALDIVPQPEGAAVYARIGGYPSVLDDRLARLRKELGTGHVLPEDEEREFWAGQREFTWLAEGAALVKVPTTPTTLPALDVALSETGAVYRVAVGGNLVWLAWHDSLELLEGLLAKLNLAGLVLRGAAARPIIGHVPVSPFGVFIRTALDPSGRFVDDK